MIPLRLRADAPGAERPFVVRLRNEGSGTPHDAILDSVEGGVLRYRADGIELGLRDAAVDEIDGDVLLVNPERRIAHRVVRARSVHNAFLVTERCDQLCVMCSQPPKRHHVDVFPLLTKAALLAPQRARITITGGEPTLFKDRLFTLLEIARRERPDIGFHVLTNGQHFVEDDADRLRDLGGDVLWGIPLYSHDAAVHDTLVGKAGAFSRLRKSFPLLARSGAQIELRTVVMRPNVDELAALAAFITTFLPFISVWAIMQLENIGYARRDWDALFFDSGQRFDAIAAAIDVAKVRGVPVRLYNFPLCSVPLDYRSFALPTISDWKRRYLAACDGCRLRAGCGGFFEWYPDDRGFARVGLS